MMIHQGGRVQLEPFLCSLDDGVALLGRARDEDVGAGAAVALVREHRKGQIADRQTETQGHQAVAAAVLPRLHGLPLPRVVQGHIVDAANVVGITTRPIGRGPLRCGLTCFLLALGTRQAKIAMLAETRQTDHEAIPVERAGAPKRSTGRLQRKRGHSRREEEWWTAMRFPVGSRTTVQGATQTCLTSVFGMRTGEPGRYGRPTTNVMRLDIESMLDAHAAYWK